MFTYKIYDDTKHVSEGEQMGMWRNTANMDEGE